MPSEADKQAVIAELQNINSELVRLSTDIKLVSPTNVVDRQDGGEVLYKDLDDAHEYLSACRKDIDQAIDQVNRIKLPEEDSQDD